MWGLDTLAVMNNPRLARRKRPTDPREILAEKLTRAVAPPSLTYLIGQMRDYQDYGDFIGLIKEFLPEHERVILSVVSPSDQMAAFASRFEDRYFPLQESVKWEEYESYRDLTAWVPAIVSGMGWDDYDDIPSSDNRLGVQLLTWLFDADFTDDGERVALFEACKEHVSEELLTRVPRGGFRNDVARELLSGTRFEKALKWSDYINHNTDNYFLDTDWESFSSGYWPDWARETVDHLTVKWQEAEQHGRDQEEFFEWIEKDPEAHFRELLEFMLERRDENSGANEGKVV